MRVPSDHMRTLRRRVDFLKSREHKNSFDLAELGALEWAIVNLQPQPAPVQDNDAHYKGIVEGVQKLFDDKRAQPAPVQEPVVFYRCNGCGHAYEQVHPTSCDCMEAGGFDRVEYYTTPPAAQKPWVGLTDEERMEIYNKPLTIASCIGAVEAKLKEKNNG